MIRIKGRLHNAPIEGHPIILPRKTCLNQLIIDDCYDRLLDAGVEQTLAEIRTQYWIIKGRVAVKQMKRNCVVCNKVEQQPFNQVPPPLLRDRVQPGYTFQLIGIDHCGPLFVKDDQQKV